ncbi:phosphotransferase family protein [Sediminibacillus albus]|uniref:Aminoglycoside 2''-phosphotransferase n=1 Tax=Sediminibacillus albus TaxID=407036 RepID=A0A1G8WXY1_9BACI|nr:aminoglycoside phosphotransferase family protein [Sediminibacillus albus]SDJ83258.1 aminoglycoside 2''-phosphotransferase [Sediminibacillus albus]
MEEQKIIQFIKERFPHKNITAIEVINTGWDNDVLLLNKELVFRFPKTKDIRKKVQTEVELLKALNERNPPVELPRPTVLENFNKELTCMYYPLINGKSLDKLNESMIKANKKNAKVMGTFLTKLHHLRNTNPAINLETSHPFDYWNNLFTAVKNQVLPLVSNREAYLITGFFSDFLHSFSNQNYRPTFIHGDLSSNNIIGDPETGKILGVIDFTDAQLGDPAFDFAGFYWDFGAAFTREVLNQYQGDDPADKIFQRVQQFYGVQPIFHELLYKLKLGHPINWQTALDKFKHLLASKE